ncbi:MAG: Gfo/Idh/MocA family oxidoreductase [Phycisphaeraceae bacterium]|nr:Gfo/Idh/MocA family oxidoreductase [Phycisphaeraceae bacterium]
MPQRFGIGVIGYGYRVGGLVSQLMALCREIELVSVCDPSPDSIASARAVAPSVEVCTTPEELTRNPRVGWVLIGSPNSFHREHATIAMRAGRHVFCEKPLATNLADCLAIRDVVRETGKSFFFGLVLRYAPLYTRIRQLLDANSIGEIISVDFNETLGFNHGGYIHQDWRRHRAAAGTHMLEKCCHDIDIVNWMVGSRATHVASFGGLRYFIPANRTIADEIGPSPTGRRAFQDWPQTKGDPFTLDKDIVDHQVAIIEYASGVRASFHTNCAAAIPERRLLLLGTHGAIRADLHTGTVELQKIGWDEPRVIYKVTSTLADHAGADAQLVVALADWIIRSAPPRTGIDHAIDSAVTCFGIDAALDERRVVDLQTLWNQAGIRH